MSQMSRGDLAKLQGAPREMDRWQKAQQHLMAGRFSHALNVYRELVNRYPEIPQLWFELGITAGGELDFALAHQALQTSASLAPQDSAMLVLIGQQYQKLRQLEHAREYFERAVAADPDSAHARLTLAAWFERERKLEDAFACVKACLARHPGNTAALYYNAFLLHRSGKNSEAAVELQKLISGRIDDVNVRYSSRHLLGVILDELGDYTNAMRWLLEAKTQVRQLTDTALLERTYDQTDRQRRLLLAAMKASDLQRWRENSVPAPTTQQLILLGGHPRSGTTLIEQILDAHPQVEAFDESEAFVQEILKEMNPSQSARGLTLDGLNALSQAGRATLRQRYFRSLLREDSEAEANAPVLIDKNPSLTAWLPLWLRVFPESKVIMPLRDPRDVVISCFFQNLTLTAGNVNFLSLERTAKHFADLTDTWLRMKELGGFDWLETRYEDVVRNLPAEGKRVTEFCGLAWDTRQEKFYEKAQGKFVFAPTYHDVTKPLHNRAVGRWENYAEALKPVMGTLKKYCKVLGYA